MTFSTNDSFPTVGGINMLLFLVQYSEVAENYVASIVYGDVSPDDMGYKMKNDSCVCLAGSSQSAIEKFKTEKYLAYRDAYRILHEDVDEYLTVRLRSNHGKTSLEVKCIPKDYLISVVLFIREIDPTQYEEILYYLGSHVFFLYMLTNLGNTPCFNTFESAVNWIDLNDKHERKQFIARKGEM